MEQKESEGNVKAAIEAGRALGALHAGLITIPGSPIPVAVMPDGYRLQDLETLITAYLPAPPRIQASPVFYDATSYRDYVRRFAGTGSVIFAHATPSGSLSSIETTDTLIAILDYHEPDSPHWGDHKATLHLRRSPEWVAWAKIHGTAMEQVRFANFLEDRIEEVIEPPAGRLIDLARNLEVTTSTVYRKKADLTNGDSEYVYKSEEKGAGNIVIPGEITLRLRYYLDQDPLDVKARLRRRLTDEGQLVFTVIVDRLEQLSEDAFNAVCDRVGSDTGLPVYRGRP